MIASDSRIRRTPEDIKIHILSALTQGPLTIQQVVEKTHSHFPVTKKFLDELKSEGKIVESVSEKNLKVFLRSDYPVFYKIPISRNHRKKTLAILHAIVKEYQAQTKTEHVFPYKTIIQKAAVEYIEKNDPSLPVLHFRFGKICSLAYDENIHASYGGGNLTDHEMKQISEVVETFASKTVLESKKYQYEQEGMEFYKIREEIVTLLSDVGKNKKELSDAFITWSVYYPEELEDNYHIFDKFTYSAINLLRLKEIDDELSLQLKDSFNALWNYVTTTYFFETAKRFISMEKRGLFNLIKDSHVSQEKLNVEIVISDFESVINNLSEDRFSNEEVDNKTQELLHLLLEE